MISCFVFQPTRPLRGATTHDGRCRVRKVISTHAPLAGRDESVRHPPTNEDYFNPRAPCGARLGMVFVRLFTFQFQPTRPLRGATIFMAPVTDGAGISTHAPLAGRDHESSEIIVFALLNFNPRAPCGARLQKCTNHYAHFCDNRQISDAFAQNADCQGILFLFDAGKPCGFWVRTAQVISARLCFAL